MAVGCGFAGSSANCSMLMKPNKAETAVHDCWLLSSIFILLGRGGGGVETGFYPFIPSTTAALVRMPVAFT